MTMLKKRSITNLKEAFLTLTLPKAIFGDEIVSMPLTKKAKIERDGH